MLQNLERNHILHAHAHRMAGEPFSVGHHNFFSRFTKRFRAAPSLQPLQLPPRAGVIRLVGHEDELRGQSRTGSDQSDVRQLVS